MLRCSFRQVCWPWTREHSIRRSFFGGGASTWRTPIAPFGAAPPVLVCRQRKDEPGSCRAPPSAAEADVRHILLFLGGALALGTTTWMLTPKAVIRDSARAADLTYLCEGDQNVVCAYIGRRKAWRGCLLQLSKDQLGRESAADPATSFLHRATLQHALADYCFDWRFVDCPQVIALPEGSIRSIDAHILTSRPPEHRQHRLGGTALSDYPGRTLALRSCDLMQAPPGAQASPFVTVDIRLGCGIKENNDLPSRHAMRVQLARPSGASLAGNTLYEPLALFSGDRQQAAAAVKQLLAMGLQADELRIYVDAQPAYPAQLQSVQLDGAGGAAPANNSAAGLGSFCYGGETGLAQAVAAMLTAPGRRNLALDLVRLQSFAAGECERMAGRIIEELQANVGEEALNGFNSTNEIRAVLARAARFKPGPKGVAAHEQEGRRLMALAKWGPREVEAAKRWLMLFLLGRGAMHARLLLNFAKVGPEADPAIQRQLRKQRFIPMTQLMPNGEDQSWATDLWVRTTVVGIEPRGPAEIPLCATEFEGLAQLFRERCVLP